MTYIVLTCILIWCLGFILGHVLGYHKALANNNILYGKNKKRFLKRMQECKPDCVKPDKAKLEEARKIAWKLLG